MIALWESDPAFRAGAEISSQRGKMLYETMPQLFPQGFLTEAELTVWGLHARDQMERNKAAQAKARRR